MDNEDQISEDNSFSSFESMDDNFVDYRRLFLLKKVLKSLKKFINIMDNKMDRIVCEYKLKRIFQILRKNMRKE